MICQHCGHKTKEDGILTVDAIKYAVAKHFKMDIPSLIQKKRDRSIVYPRHIVIYFLREGTRLGWKDIGKVFNQDHTTAIYGYNTIRDLMEVDNSVMYDVLMIKDSLFECEVLN